MTQPSGPPPFPNQPAWTSPGYPQQVVTVTTTSAPTSGWATASLVLGLVGLSGGFFCMLGIPCVLAVITGHIALQNTKDGTKGGRGLAVAGLILGYLFVLPAAAILIFGTGALLGTPTPSVSPTP